jgi:hypothetical protein
MERDLMDSLTVVPVATGRQKKQFLAFPWRLYRDTPHWVPTLRSEERELAGYGHHPFFEKNLIQTFLALQDGEVCGRIAAIVNRDHIEYQKEERGFFGFFECVDDQPTANALFDAARQWLGDHDIHCMRGPTNPGMNYTWGTLIDSFDKLPTFMMTYNRDYYPRLIEGYGFRKAQDLYSFFGYRNMLAESTAKLGALSEQIVEHLGIKMRTLDKSRFLEEVQMFLDLYNQSMTQHWGFAPMSPAEVRHTAKGLRHLLVPEVTAVAEIEGRMIGACFGIPDFNPTIQRIDGRLFPFGFFHLLRAKRRATRVRLVSTNVMPEYQMSGVGLVLMQAMVATGGHLPVQEVEYSWVAESNRMSMGALKKGGAILERTHRVYDWDPEGPAVQAAQS